MKVINLKDLKIDEYSGETAHLAISIEVPNLDLPILEFDSILQKLIFNQLNTYIDDNMICTVPLIFDFTLNNFSGDAFDFKSVTDCILSIFNQWFVNTKEGREREYRFGLPKELSSIADTQLHLMKMINYETKFDNFSVKIQTEDLTYQFEYIGGEN